jgi:hypothetical protein
MIILAIAGLNKIAADVCVSGTAIGMRRFLEQQSRIKVWHDYSSLLEQAANASALVHHGVHDVAEQCIALGRPQLIIPWTREMAFSWMKPPTVSIDEMACTFRDLLRDTSLTVAAQHHARQFANTSLGDARSVIVEKIENVDRR